MVAGNDAFTITRASFTVLPVQDNDVPETGDLNPFATEIVDPPSRGTVAVHGLTIRYTPNPGESAGVDSFVYRTCDEGPSCDTATVTLTLAVT